MKKITYHLQLVLREIGLNSLVRCFDGCFMFDANHEVNLREATQTNLQELKESLHKESKEANLAG